MKFTITINENTVKLKQDTVLLKTPLSFEKDEDWKEIHIILSDGSKHGGYSQKYFTIKKDKIIGIHPNIAKKFNLDTVGNIQPKTEKALAKIKAQLEKEEQEAIVSANKTKVGVFLLTLNDRVGRINNEIDRTTAVDIINDFVNRIDLTPVEKVDYINKELKAKFKI